MIRTARRTVRTASAAGLVVLALGAALSLTAPAQAAATGPTVYQTKPLKNDAGVANGCTAQLRAHMGQLGGSPAVKTTLTITCPDSAGVQVIRGGTSLYERMADGTIRTVEAPTTSGQGPGPSEVFTSKSACSFIVSGSGSHDLIIRAYPRTSAESPWVEGADHPHVGLSVELVDACAS